MLKKISFLEILIFLSIIFLPFDNKTVFNVPIGLLGIWLLLNIKRGYKLLKYNKIGFIYLLFLSLLGILSLFSDDPMESLKGYFQVFIPSLIIFLGLAVYFLEKGEIALKRLVYFCLIPLTLFLTTNCWYLLKGVFPWKIFYYGNANNTIASLIVFFAPLVFALLISPPFSSVLNILKKISFFLVFITSIIILTYSNGRASFFGFLSFGIFLGIGFLFYSFSKKGKMGVILGISLLILISLALTITPKEIWKITVSDIKSRSFSNRHGIWVGAFYAIKERPLTGYGWYRNTFTNQFREKFHIYPDRRGLSHPDFPRSAHNVFLEMAFASGLPGLIGFLIVCSLAIKNCLYNLFKDHTSWKVASLWILVGGYLIAGQFTCFYRDYPWVRFSIVMAIVSYIYKKNIEKR